MSTGNKKFFTKKHIEAHRQHTSVILAEQVVHCLELVASLVREELDFMFKGGNSLLVLLENPKRFSIDVDIATDETKDNIDIILDNMVKNSDIFTAWARRTHKTKPWLPMTSYYVFYRSHFTETKETSIMLDAQLKMSPYKKINKPVSCGTLYQSEEEVLLPSTSSLAGDKLLTLGPATLGIPLNKGKEAQRLKHSFDISLLAGTELNIEEIRESIDLCMIQENKLQESNFNLEEVFSDTIKYCGTVVNYPQEPSPENLHPYLAEIVKGRLPFQDHIFAEKYTWQDLQIDFARTALCLTGAFCKKITSKELNRTLNGEEKDIKDTEDFKNLRESNYRAYYYWCKIREWLGKNPLI